MNTQKLLNEYYLEAEKIVRDLNIKIGTVKRVIPTKAQRWGDCKKNPDNTYEIRVNKVLIKEDKREEAIQTLIHELLHTVNKCMNHGKRWKQLAYKVSCNTSYEISRTTSCEHKGVDIKDLKKVNYIVKCTGCGSERVRTRMSKLVKHPEFYRCGNCGSKLERIK